MKQIQSRSHHTVTGQVQGVGFRPFIFTLAEKYDLSGYVCNAPEGVIIEVQGSIGALASFRHEMLCAPPPLAQIFSHAERPLPPIAGEASFSIRASESGASHNVLISPDTGLCPACHKDMQTPGNRRFGYAFTNCTNCGPRYTITRSIPYDRATTSMGCFPLCPKCQQEYENPRDRRFHAQPNACPVCGPSLIFFEAAKPPSLPLVSSAFVRGESGAVPEADIAGITANRGDTSFAVDQAALSALALALTEGKIAAIKGLGGFHLTCDATSESAVQLLRQRKNRPHKPFAVMVDSISTASRLMYLNQEARALLASPEHPVVIGPLLEKGKKWLAHKVAPNLHRIGIMLPYTPLHAALFAAYKKQGQPDGPDSTNGTDRMLALVMTSGNSSGDPICLGNREAIARLAQLADVFLCHNRDILVRVDDSVVQPLPDGKRIVHRRARGFVPRPVYLACDDVLKNTVPEGHAASAPHADYAPVVMGVGAELKNTLCLLKGNNAFVSQHIGDMVNIATAAFHQEIALHLQAILAVRPEAIVRDLHPDYTSSHLAEQSGLPVFRLQHHAAHAYALLAENTFTGKALVLTLDGTGLGDDHSLWGGEAIITNTHDYTHSRAGHLTPLALPGGEAAIKEPWRIAHAFLVKMGVNDAELQQMPWLPAFRETAPYIAVMREKNLNTPLSSSCGRLFDAASAMLGLCNTITYEGQAAILLEEAQYQDMPVPSSEAEAKSMAQLPKEKSYDCPLAQHEDTLLLDTEILLAELYADICAHSASVAVMARRFHQGLASGLGNMAFTLCRQHALAYTGITGGCMQNTTLFSLLVAELHSRGLTPLVHHELPPGDGSLSLGQAVWGRAEFLRTQKQAEK